MNDTQCRIKKACDELAGELCAKNEAYGDSALHPAGIFAKGSAVEGIKVRIDDKLNRIKNKPDAFGEDPIKDLLGYLILLKLALEDEKNSKLENSEVLAQRILGLPLKDRRVELEHLKKHNEELNHRVVARLDAMRALVSGQE